MRHVLRCLVLMALVVGTLSVPLTAQAATKRTITVSASSTTPTVSSVVTFTGKVSRSPKRTAVQLQRASGKTWVKVASTRTTSSKGSFAVKVRVPSTGGDTRYRAYAPKTSKLKAATSASRTLDVRRKVAITSALSPSVVGVGSNAELSGTVSPGVAGTTVTIQKIDGTTVTTVAATTVAAGGTYTVTLPQPTVGQTAYRASMPARKGYVAAVSPTRTVEVRETPVPPSITTNSLPVGLADSAYSATLQTAGNQQGTWSVTPALPAGLSLAAATGRITGKPTGGSSATYTVRFTHVNGFFAEKQLKLTVNARARITTTSLPDTTLGATYDQQLTAEGGPGTWKYLSGSTPPGTGLGSDGRITGTPTKDGKAVFTVAFKSSVTGLSDERQLSITVHEKAVATTGLASGTVGKPYSFQLRTNGDVPGTWRMQGGTPVPLGLTLSSGGLLSGTPTTAGTTQFFLEFQRSGGTSEAVTLPLTIEADVPFSKATTTMSAGDGSACRVLRDQSLSCWGFNFQDHFGIGQQPGHSYAAPTTGPGGPWRSVSDGSFAHACAIKIDASLWCMGYNGTGQLGTGSSVWRSEPTRVAGQGAPTAWKQVSADQSHTCGISAADELWCWGMSQSIGKPSQSEDALSPVLIGSGWKKLATGGATCGIKTDDTLWCWSFGAAPAKVGSATWSSVSQKSNHACGIQTNGSLWCWGSNTFGELGNGTTTASTVPVRVGSRTDWSTVAVGGRNARGFTCATTTSGEGWCWGLNVDGQLGNGSTTDSSVPVRIDSTTSWSSIVAGTGFACGVKSDESQRCWGSGGGGQLGDGRTRDSTVPVTVAATRSR